MRSTTAPEGSRDVLRSRKASPSCGSSRSIHRGPALGSSAADGSLAPGPPAKCTKTTRPDPQTCHACSSPAIRDDKVNHQVSIVARGFFSKLLVDKSRELRAVVRHKHRDQFSRFGVARI